MAKYLDQEGLKVVWGKIKEKDSAVKSEVMAEVNKKANVNHTHTVSQITDLQSKLDTKLNASLKGTANGVASLDASGKVPSSQLPSYVDDVLEFDNKTAFPATGETGKIYIAKDNNKTYRWSGSTYAEISSSLALGETSSTAYPGDKGKANATKITTLESKVSDVEISVGALKTAVKLTAEEVAVHQNDISAIKTDLGNKANKSDVNAKLDKQGKIGTQNYAINRDSGLPTFTIEANSSTSFDGDFSFIGLTDTNLTLMAGSDGTDKASALQAHFNSEGTINFINCDEFKRNNNQILDESMALTEAEINAICV